MLVWGVAAAAQASLPVPSGAKGSALLEEGVPQVEGRLLVHPDDDPQSGSVRLGVWIELAEGWHIYWRNPGDSGLPPQLTWDLPGAALEPLPWPAPAVFSEADGFLTTYGYSDSVLLVTRARFAAPPDPAAVARVQVGLLVCRYECVPAELTLERALAAPDPAPPGRVRALFETEAARRPAGFADLGLALAARTTPGAVSAAEPFAVELELRCIGADPCPAWQSAPDWPVFLPEDPEALVVVSSSAAPDPETGKLRITLGAELESDSAAPRLQGLVWLADETGSTRAAAVDWPLPVTDPELASAVSTGLWTALLLAFLGGVILNGMPCVLPVLAIKMFGVAALAHRSRREVLAHGAAYTAGILASMTALAGVVIGLRLAGTAVGWGFQFQEPIFIVAVSAVLTLFALNLFGVFEIQFNGGALADVGASAAGARRSFFDGLLAVVLSTPCSAPFLGTAVGLAFASSAPVVIAVFGLIGLGLAAPYLVVTLVPGWARIMPKPGPWMLRLRAGLGFAVLSTVVWMAWILGQSTGVEGVVTLLILLVGLAFAAWVFGGLQASGRRAAALGGAMALVTLLVAGPALVSLDEGEPQAPTAETSEWRPFETSAIQSELDAGRAVFVTFTADWCVTCKVNERFVIDDERVRRALADGGFALFKADWTRRDEAIRQELARFGKAGVPLYLVYDPERPGAPDVLPELLTVDRVLDSVQRLGGEPPRLAETEPLL
ncbi:MAG: thioredoxin family protein [Proteobacteria bacterium]|nr:thioredoxin family protein [Pseudomonadota bacterium]